MPICNFKLLTRGLHVLSLIGLISQILLPPALVLSNQQMRPLGLTSAISHTQTTPSKNLSGQTYSHINPPTQNEDHPQAESKLIGLETNTPDGALMQSSDLLITRTDHMTQYLYLPWISQNASAINQGPVIGRQHNILPQEHYRINVGGPYSC